MTFPSPLSLGLGPLQWRPEQDRALWDALGSERRFIGVDAPTGMGKSLLAMGLAKAMGARVAYLTGTKQLQDQLTRDFGFAHDVRGQSNYRCLLDERVMVSEGPCHAGTECHLKAGGCLYYDRVRRARVAESVVTNYALWLTSYRYGEGLGTFDLLVCDEGHTASEWVVQAASVEWGKEDTKVAEAVPPVAGWASWAAGVGVKLQTEMLVAEPGSRRARQLRDTIRKLGRFPEAGHEKEWVRVAGPEGVTIRPIWPSGAGSREGLFQNIRKVLLVSATLREHELDLLQIREGERDFFEYGSGFATRNRPIWYLPAAKVTAQMPDSDRAKLIAGVDAWIEEWKQHKGLIHTVSYDWQVRLLQASKHRGIMYAPGKGESFERAMARFRAARAPAVFVSPRAREGVDLPDDAARWQIILKLPFPNSGDPVMQARTSSDKQYGYKVTARELVQSTGRIVRSADDWGVTVILDANWKWFQWAAKDFLPRWWKAAVRQTSVVPKVRVT